MIERPELLQEETARVRTNLLLLLRLQSWRENLAELLVTGTIEEGVHPSLSSISSSFHEIRSIDEELRVSDPLYKRLLRDAVNVTLQQHLPISSVIVLRHVVREYSKL